MAPPIDGPPDGPGNGRKFELGQRLSELSKGHPSSPRYGADQPRLTYWELVGEFDKKWAEHEKRWPERADKIRPSERSMSPDQVAEADSEIAKMRAPEKSITATLRRIEQENTYGGVLAGLDKRLKGDERLKDKIAETLRKEPGSTVADAAETVWDAVRYTFLLDRDKYVHGYGDITDRVSAAGWQIERCDNNWLENPEYKGVNTRWITPEGARVELQFHTAESLDAKELRTHRAYERLRQPQTTWEERGALEAYQRLVSSAVPVPDGVAVIENYRRPR